MKLFSIFAIGLSLLACYPINAQANCNCEDCGCTKEAGCGCESGGECHCSH